MAEWEDAVDREERSPDEIDQDLSRDYPDVDMDPDAYRTYTPKTLRVPAMERDDPELRALQEETAGRRQQLLELQRSLGGDDMSRDVPPPPPPERHYLPKPHIRKNQATRPDIPRMDTARLSRGSSRG